MRAIITALSPIAHGAFGEADIGNAVALRREPIVSLPGFPRVPCVSGNAIRGVVRRAVMRELFETAGLSRAKFEEAGKSRAWDRLYAALANGGHLESAEKRVDPAAVRALRESLPTLSVLGAALFSQLLAGRASFGIAWPRCRETTAAGLVTTPSEIPAEDLVTETSMTRHVDREQQDPQQSGVTPMPVTVETLAVGTVLEAEIELERATEVERGVIARGLDLVTAIGGKGGAGLGRVRVQHDGDARPYAAWLEAARPTLAATLTALAERLAKAGAEDEAEKAEKKAAKKAAKGKASEPAPA